MGLPTFGRVRDPRVRDPHQLYWANDTQDCDFYQGNSESRASSIRLTMVMETQCAGEHHVGPDDGDDT